MAAPESSLALVVGDDEPSCFGVLAIIQCYLDCECDPATMLAIASHLDRCSPCRAELEGLRALKAAVRRCSGLRPAT
jgi:anti-sigma factor RsiW